MIKKGVKGGRGVAWEEVLGLGQERSGEEDPEPPRGDGDGSLI